MQELSLVKTGHMTNGSGCESGCTRADVRADARADLSHVMSLSQSDVLK